MTLKHKVTCQRIVKPTKVLLNPLKMHQLLGAEACSIPIMQQLPEMFEGAKASL